MKKSIRLYITGVFQKMFFRSFIKENAERENVKGFIRNLDDGRMEIFLEGDSEKVMKLIQLCQKGPKHAKIKNIQFKKERYQGFKNFKVLHI